MRKFHQILGLVMLLPFIAWAVTGVFFFFKPGYQEAYQPLAIKTYPVTSLVSLPKEANWLEVKQLKTDLGQHLLVKNDKQWQQLSLDDFSVIEMPTELQLRQLVEKAIADKPERYGNIVSIEKLKATTNTGVEITLNWQQMSLRQYGEDTDFINTIYNIHYLRWTGNKTIDQYLGVIGLLLVVLLAGIGTYMTFRKPKTQW